MALVDIIKKIEADAESEAQSIVAQAKQESDTIRQEMNREVSHAENEAEKARKRRAARVREHLLARARHEAQFMYSSFQNERIEDVFIRVQEKLMGLSEADYTHFIEKTLKEVPTGAEFEVAHEREKETKKILEKHGVSAKDIHVASEGALLGGYRAATKTEEYDMSFVGLLQNLREQYKSRVAQELFS